MLRKGISRQATLRMTVLSKPGVIALPWHFGSMPRNPPMAVRATIRNRRWSEQLGDDGAADLRQRRLRRRSVVAHLLSPTRRLQAPVLQIGTADAGHQGVAMQAGPGPALEVAEPQFLLELLMYLLARPARLDGGDQPAQRSPLRQVAEVVFLLAAVAP